MGHHEREPVDIHLETRRADRLLNNILVCGGTLGLVILGATFAANFWFAKDGLQRFSHAYLVNFSFFLSLSLGALFFVIVHHLTRAGWSAAVRRIAEFLAANIPILAVLALPVLAMAGIIYPWASHGPHAEELARLPGVKAFYLSVPVILIRCALYFVLWAWIAWRFLAASTRQDRTGDPAATTRLERFSPAAILLYAVTVTFFAFDFLMSLAPMWYSAIFGVYFFSGCVVGFLALFPIVCAGLQKRGILRRAITTEHYHDIGKLLFAFVMFWAYVAFSQYMLIWYANIPEETAWYSPRQTGQWGWIGLLLVAAHFAIPFVGLMPRASKRRKPLLLFWCAWMLLMHYIDLYWIVVPPISPARVPFSLTDLGCLLGIGGIFLAGVALTARGRLLIAERDPRLPESLAFENI